MTTKLDNGQKHFLRLIARDQQTPDGWCPVSKVVYPLVQKTMPAELVEHQATETAAVASAQALAPEPAPAARTSGFAVPASVRTSVLRPAAPVADTRPPITTGALCARFGDGFTVTAQFLTGLGITAADRPKEAKSGTYWREADFPAICAAIASHAQRVALGEEVAA